LNQEQPPDANYPDDEERPNSEPEENGPPADVSPTFEERIKIALQEAFPILLDRLQKARFANWHRQSGLLDDLAQTSLLNVFCHCRNRRVIPDNLVAYLVTTAKHLAFATWKERRDGPRFFAELRHFPARPGVHEPPKIDFDIEAEDRNHDGEDRDAEGKAPDTADDESVSDTADCSEDGVYGEEAAENYLAASDGDQPDGAAILRMRAAIDALPRRQREAIEIYMQRKGELTFRQMGAMMAISADGFEKNVERAMKALRSTLYEAGP
jgi:DNA-directed RNA polymerase specialized sigma24 family protein